MYTETGRQQYIEKKLEHGLQSICVYVSVCVSLYLCLCVCVGVDTETGTQQYIEKKLEHGLQRIWTDVQHKVKVYLSSTDLSAFKYDDFIQVLDIVNR